MNLRFRAWVCACVHAYVCSRACVWSGEEGALPLCHLLLAVVCRTCPAETASALPSSTVRTASTARLGSSVRSSDDGLRANSTHQHIPCTDLSWPTLIKRLSSWLFHAGQAAAPCSALTGKALHGYRQTLAGQAQPRLAPGQQYPQCLSTDFGRCLLMIDLVASRLVE